MRCTWRRFGVLGSRATRERCFTVAPECASPSTPRAFDEGDALARRLAEAVRVVARDRHDECLRHPREMADLSPFHAIAFARTARPGSLATTPPGRRSSSAPTRQPHSCASAVRRRRTAPSRARRRASPSGATAHVAAIVRTGIPVRASSTWWRPSPQARRFVADAQSAASVTSHDADRAPRRRTDAPARCAAVRRAPRGRRPHRPRGRPDDAATHLQHQVDEASLAERADVDERGHRERQPPSSHVRRARQSAGAGTAPRSASEYGGVVAEPLERVADERVHGAVRRVGELRVRVEHRRRRRGARARRRRVRASARPSESARNRDHSRSNASISARRRRRAPPSSSGSDVSICHDRADGVEAPAPRLTPRHGVRPRRRP